MAKKPSDPSKKKKRSPVAKAIGSFFGILGKLIAITFSVLIITGCIVGCVLLVYVFNMIDQDSEFDLDNIQLNYTTILYATDDSTGETYELQRINSGENRIWVDLEDIPDYVQKAVIAAEDKRFPYHNGVDWMRTIKVAIDLFNPNSDSMQGGSTITQQLIKNITGDDALRVDRKIQEIFRAMALEKKYSKDDILEAYLNVVFFGHNTNGIQAAANYYYDKDVSELTLCEAASIVAMTQNPTKYDVLLEGDPNFERRKYVLDTMLEEGYISQSEYDQAIAEVPQPVTHTQIETSSSNYNWFVDYVIDAVLEDLQEEYGYSSDYAAELFFYHGYRVYTTVDMDMQNYLEAKYADDATFPTMRNEKQPKSAMVIMDVNGQVKALVGDRGEKTGDRIFNYATDELNQNGSTMKPIGPYALAFEYDMLNFSSIIEDSPVNAAEMAEDPSISPYPLNYYSGYKGNMTVDEAIQRSTNTVAMKTALMVTPQRIFDFLRDKLHISTLVESRETSDGRVQTDIAPACMALGALTDGVSVLELTAAYQIFANGGLYTEPYVYTRVEDSEGNVVLETDTTPERVLSYDTATVMNQLLQKVVNGRYGTGTDARLSNMPSAGKTGSTNDNYDLWYVGMTPYYVAGLWFGYERNESILYNTYPTPIIWKNVMEELHADLEYKEFPYSENVVRLTYCRESGGIATDYCTDTDYGYYKESNMPDYCTVHSGAPEPEPDPDTDSDGNNDESSESSSRPGFTVDNSMSGSSSSGGSGTDGSDESDSSGGSLSDLIDRIFGE